MPAHPEHLRARILDLHRQGWPAERIAGATGLPGAKAVGMVIQRAREMGFDVPDGRIVRRRHRNRTRYHVALPPELVDRLEPAAEARGITAHRLIRELIEAIAADDLVAAVLDG